MKSRYLLGFIKTFPAIPRIIIHFFNIYIVSPSLCPESLPPRHSYIPKAPAISLTFAEKK